MTTARRLPRILMATALLLLAPAAQAQLRASSGSYEMELLVDGRPAPTFYHAGETYVLGQVGERYTIRVVNHTGRRIEAVVSVDGRDVVDGRSASASKRGYLVPAWGSVDIDGWRLSQSQVAAFRFSSVADSYAAKTGSARNVGVIGAAIFTERQLPPPRPLYVPPPFPPCDDCDHRNWEGQPGRGSAAPESKRSEAPAPSAESRPAPSVRDETRSRRPGLGTEFGEAMGSNVTEVGFVRSSSYPSITLGLRYNDRDGLVAMGVNVDSCYGYGYRYGHRCSSDDSTLRRSATPFPSTDRRYAQPPRDWRRW